MSFKKNTFLSPARIALSMASSLLEWKQILIQNHYGRRKIPVWRSMWITFNQFLYAHALALLFALCFKMSWQEFLFLFPPQYRLTLYLDLARALSEGCRTLEQYRLWKKRTEIEELHPWCPIDTFALYLSPRGESLFMELMRQCEQPEEAAKALAKVPMWTAQGAVLRMWGTELNGSPCLNVLQSFWEIACLEDFKSITIFSNRSFTEYGEFTGPLMPRVFFIVDFDMKAAEGLRLRCRDCGNTTAFEREWDAVEDIAHNGYGTGIHPTQPFNYTVYCPYCGGHAIRDDNTGKDIN